MTPTDPILIAALLGRVASLTEYRQAEAWAEYNNWSWPVALADFKPPEWDSLTRSGKAGHPLGTALVLALEKACPLKERLRYWNTVMLMGDKPNKTPDQFEVWWSEWFQA